MAMAKKQSEYIPQKPHVKVHHTSCHTLYIHIYIHIYMYIYVCMYICVCMCECNLCIGDVKLSPEGRCLELLQ